MDLTVEFDVIKYVNMAGAQQAPALSITMQSAVSKLLLNGINLVVPRQNTMYCYPERNAGRS